VRRSLILLALVLAFVGGCGGDEEASSTETVTTTPSTAAGRVYWLRDDKVWPVARELETPAVAASALAALFEGPSSPEETDLTAVTAIPSGADTPDVAVEEGTALVDTKDEYSTAALAQIVYTLTQFPTVDKVEIGGKSYTRADFEDQTPGILVESPLPFADVSSPLRATGTANTFEATFNYELTDTDGKIVDENFVTATSGTGTRGTFEFTTKTYTVPFSGVGSLIVFERSAEDGSRIKLVEIPLRMSQ
jgi:germination protein M